MKALIFSGGVFSGLPEGVCPNDYDLVLAADKGFSYAKSLGISPHIFVGDFDSLPENCEIECEEIHRLPSIKDMTDTQEAIDIAIFRGAKEITILGATGGRMDHTLANIHLLKYALDKGARAQLLDKESFITAINRPTTFEKKEGFCLSLIPLTRCEHIFINGVFYPLEDAIMDIGMPYGVSNEFVSNSAYIDPGNGVLLVMICKK